MVVVALPSIFFGVLFMKKDIKNKNQIDNIVLDEEAKNEEKKKPTAKRLFIAVVLILLAFVFAVLGFCVVGGAFDARTYCVALADTANSGGQFSDIIYPMFAQKELDISFADESIDMSGVYGLFINPYFDINSFDFPVLPFDDDEGFHIMPILGITTDSSVSPSRGITASLWNFGEFINILLSGYGAESLSFSGDVLALTISNCSDWDIFAQDNNRCGFMLIKCNSEDRSKIMSISVGDNGEYGYIELCSLFGYYPTFSSFPLTYLASSNFAHTGMFTLSSYNKDVLLSLSDFVSLTGKEFENIGSISQSDYDKYANVFTYVPIAYNSPTNSIVGDRILFDTTTSHRLFASDLPITSLISTSGQLLITPAESGLYQRYFDFDNYYEFNNFAKMAYKSKWQVYSYDDTSNILTHFSDIYVAPDNIDDILSNVHDWSYDDGKIDVINETNTVFDGIISVLQSPVNFIKTILNFEIFGINISSVVFFIISIVIVAFVLKKVV